MAWAAPARAQEPSPGPYRVAFQTEAAIGIGPGDFYNHLFGVRLDRQFSPKVSFGGYVGYANLKGKQGRAHDILPYAQVEYMAGNPSSSLRFPIRFASGYLPRNGPVVRFSTGPAFRLTPNIDLIAELFAPMFWVTGDQMLLSMNLAIELAIRF